MVIHFATREQIEVLRRTFTHPKQVLFRWPAADGEAIEETMEWETPAWVNLMEETAQA